MLSQTSPQAKSSTPDTTKFDAIVAAALDLAKPQSVCQRSRDCSRAHPSDITAWCWPCFRRYIEDCRDKNDWMAGIDLTTSRTVCGFFDHPESREVIEAALVDLTAFADVDEAGVGEYRA